MKKTKGILKFFVLPFFPEDKKLKKYWWHKLAKIVTLIVTISSLSAIFWIASIFYFDLPKNIIDLTYWIAWLPLNFTNLFSNLPTYGTLFQYFLTRSPLGPFTMIVALVILFYFLPSLLYGLILLIYQNFHLKKVRIMLPLIIIALILFSIYASLFQQLINEGSDLADEHCIKINPLIIDRKNKYLDQYSIMVTGADSKLFAKALNDYRISTRKYIDEEKIWLEKNKKFLSSNTFNFIMPAILKEAANYQFQMYEAQYLTSLYIEQAWDEKDKNIQVELTNKVTSEVSRSNEMQDKYNKTWENGVGKRSWMFNFIKVPASKCPDENYDIPVIPNPFEPLPEEIVEPPLS